MQYLGGKFRIANRILDQIPLEPHHKVWEPFMGGANFTEKLVKRVDHVFASDMHPALISLYQAVKGGWLPPDTVSEVEYECARDLPDTDPWKAFAGFGCSFGGKYFGGYARGAPGRNYAAEAKRALLRVDWSKVALAQGSFFDRDPPWVPDMIYCDPPYANTTGYQTGAFPHDRFWRRCQEWVSVGVAVLVSEYTCPVPHRVIWEHHKHRNIRGGKPTPPERLFLVEGL